MVIRLHLPEIWNECGIERKALAKPYLEVQASVIRGAHPCLS